MKTVLLFSTQPYVGASLQPHPSIGVITNKPEEVEAALRSVHRVGKNEEISQKVLEAIKGIADTEMANVEYC